MITINGKSPPSLGVSGLIIELRNQDTSTATITLKGSQAAAAAALGDAVTIAADDLTFVGTIDAATWSHTGNTREWQVVARDGWGTLADTTIYGSAALADLAIARDTRVVLGGRFQAIPDSSDFEIRPMALNAWFDAITAFGGFTVEGAIPSTLIPPAEADGVKVADAIRTVLRWYAGSVATMGGTANKLTVRNASAMPAYTVPYTGRESITIRPRKDLLVTGVRIYLRKREASNVASRETVTTLDAGSIGPRAFITSIDLLPAVHALAVAELELDNIEAESLAWWKKALPGVFQARPEFNGSSILDSNVFRPDAALDHIILAGSLPKDFRDGCSGPFTLGQKIITVANATEAKVDTVRATATLSGLSGAPAATIAVEFLGTSLNDSSSPKTRFAREDIAARDLGESPAEYADLATTIYNEARVLKHEGSVSWRVSQIPSFAAGPMGKRLSFTGAPIAEWNTLAAPVHLVRVDCFRRQITAEFGPDTYLNVPDRIALERAQRNWNRPKRRKLAEDGTEPPPASPPGPPTPPTISQPPEETDAPPQHPWAVTVREKTNEDGEPLGTYEAMIHPGDIYGSPALGSRITPTGLTLGEWFFIAAGELIYIETEYDPKTRVRQSVEIKVDSAIDTDSNILFGADKVYELNETEAAEHIKTRTPIALIEGAEEGGELYARQIATTNFIQAGACVAGKSVILLRPL